MLHHRLRASLMGNRQATYIGGSSAIGTATLTLPAHQAGDLLVVMGADGGDGFNSPAGWTKIVDDQSSPSFVIVCYKVAASSSETSGTWSNRIGDTRLAAFVWRGAHSQSPIGASSYRRTAFMSEDDIYAPALTANVATSWIACITLAIRYLAEPFTTNGAPTTFTGMTIRSNDSSWRRAWDSNGPKSSLSATTVSSASGSFAVVCFEIAL